MPAASNEEKLILPVHDKPTFFNQDIFKGVFWGSLLFSIGGAVLGALGLVPVPSEVTQFINEGFTASELSAAGSILQSIGGATIGLIAGSGIGTLAGGVYGGLRGKEQMQRDLENGKEVREPTFWNKSIFTGLFIASAIGYALETAIVTAGFALGETGASAANVIGTLVGGIAPIFGAVQGGLVGKETMRQEYNQALALKEQERITATARTQEASLTYSLQPQQGHAANPYKNSVSQEEAQALEARIKSGAGKADFAVQLEAARNQPVGEIVKA